MGNRRTAPTTTATGDAMRDIGGAVVRRRFTMGGQDLTNGTTLTAGEVLSIPINNRRSLQDNGFLQIFPKAVRSHLEADPTTVAPERHIVNMGFGNYDVIEGTKINAFPLNKAQAQALVQQLDMEQPASPIPTPTVIQETSSPASSQDETISALRKN